MKSSSTTDIQDGFCGSGCTSDMDMAGLRHIPKVMRGIPTTVIQLRSCWTASNIG